MKNRLWIVLAIFAIVAALLAACAPAATPAPTTAPTQAPSNENTNANTNANMNANEVIAYRAHVNKGGSLNDKEKYLHPNDDVNKSQSSNDTFPTAMHIAAYKMLVETTIPGIKKLRELLADKSEAPDESRLG